MPQTLSGAGTTTISIASQGIENILADGPVGVTISDSRQVRGSAHIQIGSVFLQDSFQVNRQLSVLYGVRWELTPPASIAYNSGLGAWSGQGTTFSPADNAFFPGPTWLMHFNQFAPRFGLAYHLAKPAVVVRAGGGVFYDTALASLIDSVNLSPFTSWQFVPIPPSFNPVSEETLLSQLSLPRIWEWRASIEKPITAGQSFLWPMLALPAVDCCVTRQERTRRAFCKQLISIATAPPITRPSKLNTADTSRRAFTR